MKIEIVSNITHEIFAKDMEVGSYGIITYWAGTENEMVGKIFTRRRNMWFAIGPTGYCSQFFWEEFSLGTAVKVKLINNMKIVCE